MKYIKYQLGRVAFDRMSITIKRRHKKHVKRVIFHACPQIVVQFPITITGTIAIYASNSIPVQASDPHIVPYFIIPGMIAIAVESIRRIHPLFR